MRRQPSVLILSFALIAACSGPAGTAQSESEPVDVEAEIAKIGFAEGDSDAILINKAFAMPAGSTHVVNPGTGERAQMSTWECPDGSNHRYKITDYQSSSQFGGTTTYILSVACANDDGDTQVSMAIDDILELPAGHEVKEGDLDFTLVAKLDEGSLTDPEVIGESPIANAMRNSVNQTISSLRPELPGDELAQGARWVTRQVQPTADTNRLDIVTVSRLTELTERNDMTWASVEVQGQVANPVADGDGPGQVSASYQFALGSLQIQSVRYRFEAPVLLEDEVERITRTLSVDPLAMDN